MATAELRESATSGKPASGPGRAGRIQCVVVSPEKKLLDELVDSVVLPLYDGELGVFPGRAPMIGRLGFGELRINVGGQVRRFFVEGGFAQVRDNVLTVLSARTIPAADIDPDAVREDLARSRALAAKTVTEIEARERAIARARTLLRLGTRRA